MRLWVTIILAALVGCGEDPRTLTRDDVSAIPAGDAVGAQFSGEYLIASNKIGGCHCRAGSCATLVGLTGIPLEVTQTEGVLQMTVSTSTAVAQGGVNADGSYTLGSVLEDPDNIQYALVTGRFTLSGGTPNTMTGAQEVTVHSPIYDCDIRSSFISMYVGPLAAAADVAHTAASSGGAGGAFGLVGVSANATR